MSYWERTDKHAGSFMGRTSRFGTVDGPLELYAFSSRPDRPSKPDPDRPGKADPMFFMAGAPLAEAIRGSGGDAGGSELRESIRQGVALCEDWNSMTYLFILDVPGGLAIEAWFVLAKRQPRVSGDKTGNLQGGWLQYIVDLNDMTAKYLRGPIKTGW